MGISFYNLLSERIDRSNFAATVLFIAVFICAEAVDYLLCRKPIVIFFGCYFALHLVCSATALVMNLTDISHNVFTVYCSVFFSPFYGFVAISEAWAYVAIFSAFIMTAVPALLIYKLFAGEKK